MSDFAIDAILAEQARYNGQNYNYVGFTTCEFLTASWAIAIGGIILTHYAIDLQFIGKKLYNEAHDYLEQYNLHEYLDGMWYAE